MSESGEPRWLNGEERRAWLALAGLMIRLPAALESQLQREAGLSHFEYYVLAMLSEAPRRSTRMSDLADLANGSLSRLSHVVSRLERRGWVQRRPDPEDGRYTLAVLTEPGWEKIVSAAPGHVAIVRRLVFDVLTDVEQNSLREVGESILAAIEVENSGPPCP